MNTQAKGIFLALEAVGWKLEGIASPTSKHYWWVWEFWTLQKEGERLVLSFLIDPQLEKSKTSVWAVSATKTEPDERREAESGPLLTLNKGWENHLEEFVESISSGL